MLKLRGRNRDIQAFLRDMKHNGETMKEAELKFKENPTLCEIIKDLYAIEITVKEPVVNFTIIGKHCEPLEVQ